MLPAQALSTPHQTPNGPAAAADQHPWAWQVQPEDVELVRRDYAANSGWETFLAYEDPAQDILASPCCTSSPLPDAGGFHHCLRAAAQPQALQQACTASSSSTCRPQWQMPCGRPPAVGQGGVAARQGWAGHSQCGAQVGLLRLRKCSGAAKDRQPTLLGRVSLVRELHVYGTAVAVHARDAGKLQHQVCSGRRGCLSARRGGRWCCCCTSACTPSSRLWLAVRGDACYRSHRALVLLAAAACPPHGLAEGVQRAAPAPCTAPSPPACRAMAACSWRRRSA